jgi:hypothetical protein
MRINEQRYLISRATDLLVRTIRRGRLLMSLSDAPYRWPGSPAVAWSLILAFEIGTVSLSMKHDEILRVGRVDNWYSIAGVLIIVRFIRATCSAR